MKNLGKVVNGQPLPAAYGLVLQRIRRVLGPSDTDASNFSDSDLYAEKYLSHNLVRKSLHFSDESHSEEDRAKKTLGNWFFQESVNKRFNQSETFGWSVPTGTFEPDGTLGLSILLRAREIVHEIVGTFDVQRACRDSIFGNGASAQLRRTESQREQKFVSRSLSVTRGLHDFAVNYIESCTGWLELIRPQDVLYSNANGDMGLLPPGYLKVYSGGVFDMVDKTATEKRPIVKEPELNGFFQKGTGSLLRKKLRAYRRFAPEGVDLNTSGDLNSELARAGSADGHIATVDGKAASDSQTLALYEFMFPREWFGWFKLIRSPFVLINQKWHRVQMMSGMGNGFTFEAESVIFYAIGCACAERSRLPFAERYVSIHGDDLTVPSDVFAEVALAYERAGMTINTEKSFFKGPFRESCGGHFFNGRSVKPFYVKTQTGLKRGDWFWLANSLLLWLGDRSDTYRRSRKGKDLTKICQFLRWYASNGEIRKWSTSADRSRRSGLYNTEPELTGSWFKSRNVVDVQVKTPLDEAGRYITWLASPSRPDTVLELLAHKAGSLPQYEATTETRERERWVRIHHWIYPSNVPSESSLWTDLELHKIRP